MRVTPKRWPGAKGWPCEVMGEDEMKQLGMGALLAVSRGSAEPARLVTIRYDGAGEAGADSGEAVSNELIALIGKGITFDSGGISIKPAENMDEMKYDMGGGGRRHRRHAGDREAEAKSERLGHHSRLGEPAFGPRL